MQGCIQIQKTAIQNKNNNRFIFILQDGHINCEKKRCQKTCQKLVNKKQPSDDDCCQCRSRRHQGGQRRRQKQEKLQQNSPKN